MCSVCGRNLRWRFGSCGCDWRRVLYAPRSPQRLQNERIDRNFAPLRALADPLCLHNFASHQDRRPRPGRDHRPPAQHLVHGAVAAQRGKQPVFHLDRPRHHTQHIGADCAPLFVSFDSYRSASLTVQRINNAVRAMSHLRLSRLHRTPLLAAVLHVASRIGTAINVGYYCVF